jgi:NADH-quinone oxidoreductase subunit N
MFNLIEIFPLQNFNYFEFYSFLPFIILSFTAVLSLIFGATEKDGFKKSFLIGYIGLCISLMTIIPQFSFEPIQFLNGTLVFDSGSRWMSFICHLLALFAFFVTYGHGLREKVLSEIFGLIIFSLCGMILMMTTHHLGFMFISLEVMSLAIYVMVAMNRTHPKSAEAGLKYFILGGVSSALFLYGSSLLFGATGSFNISLIAQVLEKDFSPLYYVGCLFILCGLLFKVGAFPFQSWLPDVYQGAMTPVTAFMAAAVKLTGFVALIRFAGPLIYKFPHPSADAMKVFILICAMGSIIYGNFAALTQTELKRLLAYSTIAHTGYLLVGLNALSMAAFDGSSLVTYLIFYAFSILGFFSLMVMIVPHWKEEMQLEQLAGLGKSHPYIAGGMAFFLLSMAGIPMTSGFIGKYLIFSDAIAANQVFPVIVAVLVSVIAAFYYLKLIVLMFMKPATSEVKVSIWKGCWITAVACLLLTLQFGLIPANFINFIQGMNF